MFFILLLPRTNLPFSSHNVKSIMASRTKQGKFRRNVPSFGFLNHITQSAVVTAALYKQEIWEAFTFTALSIIVEGWIPSPSIYPSAQHATSLSSAYISVTCSFMCLISLTIQATICFWCHLLSQTYFSRYSGKKRFNQLYIHGLLKATWDF